MKPTLLSIERRLATLETQHGTKDEPMELHVRVVSPEGELHPDWMEERHEYRHRGKTVISIMPRLLSPEERAQKVQTST